MEPLTFKGRGWFRHMMRIYASYEDEHLRAYWDSTHAFPSRRPVEVVPSTGVALLSPGYCGLDLLLDPFFLHFPRPGEAGAWYPGVEDGVGPADLLEA
ncbi:hypothetical protein PPTG_23055 [Phytophthora nicotianae INRA-310]|uniref:Uncharacterized protein n=1 Tax=Phytophthora nicotianae (strain INRA-310) TaxID=761204 RepID=W2Q697_PHYN3|nr:hypothetical protein PPTG_23055 [Phytophthora nicotianae INRA-310]ETN08084.1 hypothetical protein PPTG_23055 [Phytophthora nicotianae INRA-310]